ncbi:MAG: sigma factor-like helix-turn-helix DNA-binding protein [Actinomycetes bacterium]
MSTLAQLLDSLPEEQRIILTAHYLRGKSAADIAGMLGVPQKSVENIIAIGKAQLLKALE